MNSYVRINAVYRPTGITRFDGNPFIEALPPLEDTKRAILDRLVHYPPTPTAADLRKGELVRIAESSCANNIVYPFAEYQRAGTHLTVNLREPYVARNPMAHEDQQRRRAIAMSNEELLPFPSNWKSSAKGQSLLGISGSGKTTFADAFSLPYQVVIEHTSYKGTPFVCRQIPWIKIRVPHDATLKSLCLQFFEVVDQILENSHYVTEAKQTKSVARMVMLFAKVATAISLGAVFIDEVQNLKTAQGSQAEIVLNLFSEIIEKAGVTLVIAGTPAVEAVIDKSVRNLRKLNSGGQSNFKQMLVDDPEFLAFCDKYWEYQFVKKPKKLTKKIRVAWHACGGGNPAFTALAFMLAQRSAIGGRELIDDMSFQRVAKTDMAILEPAIQALISGDKNRLRDFDDLVFKDGNRSLLELVGLGRESRGDDGGEEQQYDEFEDFSRNTKPMRKSGKLKPRRARSKVLDVDLPIEDPLA